MKSHKNKIERKKKPTPAELAELARGDGRKAALAGLKESDCPYKIHRDGDSTLRSCWLYGFNSVEKVK